MVEQVHVCSLGIFQPIDRKIRVDYAWTDEATKRTGNAATVADFCLSTMAPNLLAAIPTSLPPWFVQALAKVIQTPATKVGWQGRTRFWEEPINVIDTLDVGLRSSYVATVYAAPLMLTQRRGLVAFTSSSGAAHYVFGPAYGVPKAGAPDFISTLELKLP